MLGIIISAAIGALLVVAAVNAIRSGSLAISASDEEGKGWQLQRGSPIFCLVVLAIGGAGAGLIGTAGYHGLSDLVGDPPAPQTVRGRAFAVTVPGHWRRLDELIANMTGTAPRGGSAVDMVAYGVGDSELMVLAPKALPLAGEGSIAERVAAVVESMKDPALAYQRWDVTLQPNQLAVDLAYRSPRGAVVGRILVAVDSSRQLLSCNATCSFEDDGSECRAAVTSLELSASGLLPLN